MPRRNAKDATVEEEDVGHGNGRALKRRKPLTEDDDEIHRQPMEEDDDIQPQPSTRARGRQHSTPPLNGHEGHLDNDEDMDDDDGEDNTEAEIQADEMDLDLMKKRGFSWAGILESVQLDRFMSHNCFEYKLGPNVNVVNGANGSGKSAIVAALQIGLGAKATATERGSKIEDHIMHNKDSAVITIRIHNRKPKDPSEPDMTFRYETKPEDGEEPQPIYGPKIIIERRLIRKGGSSWAVKNWLGKSVDLEGRTPRTEVRDIIDHFGFMVDNPVAILTQTKSKAFLAKCRPSEHFKLYKEATLLGPLEEELAATMNVARALQVDLAQKKKNVPVVEKDLQKLEAAHKEAQELKQIDQRIADAEALFAWTVLAEAENDLGEMESQTAREFQPAATKAEEDLAKASTVVNELNDAIGETNRQLQEATARSNQTFEAMRDSKRAEKYHRLEIERHQRLAGDCENEIQEGKQSIAQVTESLNSARLEHLAGQGQKELMAEKLEEAAQLVTSLQQSLVEAQNQESTAHERKYAVQQGVPRAQDDLQNMRREFEQKRQEQMFQQGAANQGNDLYRFGQAFPDIVRRIEGNRNHFHEAPIGPIGQYIKVLDQEWAPAIESCLGAHTLQSFIVHDAHDASVLTKLLPRNPRPTIIIANLRRARYNIREHDMPRVQHMGHCTMLDMLNIQHDAVFNVLVDQSSVERLVLVGTGEDITQLGWSRLQNLAEVWNKQGERAYSRNGSNTFRKATGMRGAGRILTADRSRYLRELEDEVRGLEQRLREQEAVVAQCVNNVRQAHTEAEGAAQAVRNARSALNDSHAKKAAIEDQLSQATTAFDAKPFEDDISRFQSSVVDAEKRRDAEVRWIEDVQQKIADLEKQSREAALAARGKKEELKKLSDELEKKSSALARERSKLQHKKVAQARARQKLQAAHEEIEKKRSDVVEKMEIARRFGDRPENTDPNKNSSTKIDRTLTNLKERLEAEQERRGGKSAQDIEAEFLQAQKKHREMTKVLQRIELYDRSLQKGIKQRQITRKTLERRLRTSVRMNFSTFLQARGHTGNIRFGRNEKGTYELIITTKMASHKKGDGEMYETKDLRSLSGGERSFTTLAFMLALAEVTQNPIRVMDEIDVFQDEANRRASFKTLVEYCSSFLSDKQFIIITPLALPDIQPSESVYIVKLAPPKRRELNSGSQTRVEQYFQR